MTVNNGCSFLWCRARRRCVLHLVHLLIVAALHAFFTHTKRTLHHSPLHTLLNACCTDAAYNTARAVGSDVGLWYIWCVRLA
jgi:hypothetical protein